MGLHCGTAGAKAYRRRRGCLLLVEVPGRRSGSAGPSLTATDLEVIRFVGGDGDRPAESKTVYDSPLRSCRRHCVTSIAVLYRFPLNNPDPTFSLTRANVII